MNKQVMLSVRSKWVEQILNGTKTYEFRNRLPKDLVKGMVVNVYCTKEKPYLIKECELDEFGNRYDTNIKLLKEIPILPFKMYNGKVVASFEVGEIYEIRCADDVWYNTKSSHIEFITPLKTYKLQGYTNQRYAIEITNLKIFDKPRELSEFLYVNNNKYDEFGFHKTRLTKAPQSFCYCYDSKEVER